MRKITKALLLALVVLLTACSEDIFEGNGRHYDDDVVTVRMGINLPDIPTTRLMDGSDIPTITSLWVVVFTEDHYLKQAVQAVPCKAGANGEFLPEDDTEPHPITYFDVTLNTSDKDLIVHLVANYDLSELPFGQEGQLIGTLETSGNQDVYWQRVEGVRVEINDDNIIDANTTPKVINAPDALKEVPLVRNYAMITLENNDEENFTLTGYAITHLPDRGTVAPRIAENTFAQYFDVPAGPTRRYATCKSYADILNQGYRCNDPYDVQHSDELTWVNVREEGGVMTIDPSYVYEYNNDRSELNTMSVIVKGKYKGDTSETYYKLDLIYVDDHFVTHYYNVIRNFKYEVKIKKVSGSGFSSPEGAMARPACNNISGSTLVSNLTNISNGEYQLYVDKSSIVITRTGDVTFKYKYVKLEDGSVVNDQISIVTDGTGTGHVLSTAPTQSADGTDGWRTVTLSPNDPANHVIEFSEYVTLVDQSNLLMRRVKVTLVRPYIMKVVLNPNPVTATYNYPVTVSIYIPDGLPEAIFPLMFNINTDDNTIYPQANTDMPVSVHDGRYWFQKQLRLIDYNHLPVEKNMALDDGGTTIHKDMRRIDCYFMTNALNSATDVHVNNNYFSEGIAHLSVDPNAALLTNVGIEGTEYYGKSHPVVAKWTLGQTSNVTVTMTETSYVNADGDSLATPTVNTLGPITYNNQTAGSYSYTFNTQTFAGDVTITIQAGTQVITLHNPKKRHMILIPEGSFTFTTENGYGGYDRSGNQASDDWGVYEWPDFFVAGYASGSRKIYQSGTHAGTTAHNNSGAYPSALLEIDAQYGGRDVNFYENSEFVCHTYYNYNASGTQMQQQVFTTTVGAVCDAYNGTIVNMVMDFKVPTSGGGGAKPAWFSYRAPAKRRR